MMKQKRHGPCAGPRALSLGLLKLWAEGLVRQGLAASGGRWSRADMAAVDAWLRTWRGKSLTDSIRS